uniref:Uncharacterized protein n=1 Tax=Vitis vinifera TaxID=29760 RepID=A5BH52_VITVI|nr:hypothetical protein VITISV_016781 [Vitis vinifera]
MADKVGPVFVIRLGMYRALVVSSNHEAAKECFTSNDKVFASGPSSRAAKILGYNNAAFGLAPYGPLWREMRKLSMLEILSTGRLSDLMHVHVSELHAGIEDLYILGKDYNWVNPKKVVMRRLNTEASSRQDFIDIMLTKLKDASLFGYSRETIIKATVLHFELIPYGSGRRSCPGINMALQMLHLTTARLLEGFDMATPSNSLVDMTEGISITMPKFTPLEVMLTRLPAELY